ncbi:hypothetical protein ABZV34_31075 [Streptomyces sp. NPDC005195]|uniref:hypothetical protein n=1 Tax=Streptomyces sp. NPDC005195 TaxID=3154561 RepID=UPI0033B0FAF3
MRLHREVVWRCCANAVMQEVGLGLGEGGDLAGRTRWSAPEWEGYERVHPPVLLVFHQVGKRSAKKQMAKVAGLTRPLAGVA